jgi:hypothetical protein
VVKVLGQEDATGDYRDPRRRPSSKAPFWSPRITAEEIPLPSGSRVETAGMRRRNGGRRKIKISPTRGRNERSGRTGVRAFALVVL